MFYWFCRFFVIIYMHILYRVKVTGRENIPRTGGVILCANHTSNGDAVAVAVSFRRRLRFMAKKELFQNLFYGFCLRHYGAFPVDRDIADMNSYRTAVALLKEGEAMLIFAQGTRMQTLDAKTAKQGAAMFALKSGATVIPIGIRSSFKPFSPLVIEYGKPVDLSEFAGRKLKAETLDAATEKITDAIQACLC